MYNTKAVQDYWQVCVQQQALSRLSAKQIKESACEISHAEYVQGKIENVAKINKLLAHGSSMVLIPLYATVADNYFLPYALQVDLSAAGKFIVSPLKAWPTLQSKVLEPAEPTPLILGSANDFDQHFILQPPEWLDKPTELTWNAQRAYAQQMLSQVAGEKWQGQLTQHKYVVQSNSLIIPLSLIWKSVDFQAQANKQKKNKIELVSAARNAGKTAYAKRLILDAWIEAAVKQAPPPQHVWLQLGQDCHYASVFACVDNPTAINFVNTDLVELKQTIHTKVSSYFNAYIKGKQVVSNWQDMVDKLEFKYADKGGITVRIAQLSAALQDARARNRHLHVLNSIWRRQLELLPKFTRILDFVAASQKTRLQRLYVFFKQNFPSDDVQGFNQAQFEELFTVKMRQGINNERFIADALHQTENDVRQEDLIRNKCLQWAQTLSLSCTDLPGISDLLYKQLWGQLVNAVAEYWQVEFANVPEYADFSSKVADDIDLLIVENADYESPMRAAQLLANCKRAVIMGGASPLCTPRFSPVIDYEMTKSFGLASCDADFEDLLYDGVLGSTGNMWNFVAQGAEADKVFDAANTLELNYELINIHGQSEEYNGSRVNKAEAAAIVDYLKNNPGHTNSTAIYTSFGGQIKYLRQQLQKLNLAHVPVLPIQEANFRKCAVTLFSPVYIESDPGPYCFDLGVEVLDNLIANTQQKIVVFGDARIFKPALHSASGKFARLLLKKKEEVDCV